MKTLLLVLGILFALILLIVCALTFFSYRNHKTMQEMIRRACGCVRERFPLTERDAGEYADLRLYGILRFRVKQYDAKELGNVSVMTANMGFMQMVSFMLTPAGRKVPLCTLDFMYILGKRKSYVEFYDLVPDTRAEAYQNVLAQLSVMRARYADLPELTPAPAWYDHLLSIAMHKQLHASQDARNADMFCDALCTWLDAAKAAPLASAEETAAQLQIIQQYSDQLISKGGISTDVFKKAMGAEKTRDFFDRVFFGISNYRVS